MSLALATVVPAVANHDFEPWPPGTSPQEIGRRVAERFVASPHQNYGRPTPPKTITYPEACTWYGRAYYLARERIVGDMHGQAPVLWCAGALLR